MDDLISRKALLERIEKSMMGNALCVIAGITVTMMSIIVPNVGRRLIRKKARENNGCSEIFKREKKNVR